MPTWYVLETKRYKESALSGFLKAKGVAAYLPMIRVSVGRRIAVQSTPMFPGYLFVLTELALTHCVVANAPGVKRLLTDGSGPAVLDEWIVSRLKARENSEGFIELRKTFCSGVSVDVLAGPFRGFDAVVLDPRLDSSGRIRVLMQLLNRHVPASIPAEWVSMPVIPHGVERRSAP